MGACLRKMCCLEKKDSNTETNETPEGCCACSACCACCERFACCRKKQKAAVPVSVKKKTSSGASGSSTDHTYDIPTDDQTQTGQGKLSLQTVGSKWEVENQPASAVSISEDVSKKKRKRKHKKRTGSKLADSQTSTIPDKNIAKDEIKEDEVKPKKPDVKAKDKKEKGEDIEFMSAEVDLMTAITRPEMARAAGEVSLFLADVRYTTQKIDAAGGRSLSAEAYSLQPGKKAPTPAAPEFIGGKSGFLQPKVHKDIRTMKAEITDMTQRKPRKLRVKMYGSWPPRGQSKIYKPVISKCRSLNGVGYVGLYLVKQYENWRKYGIPARVIDKLPVVPTYGNRDLFVFEKDMENKVLKVGTGRNSVVYLGRYKKHLVAAKVPLAHVATKRQFREAAINQCLNGLKIAAYFHGVIPAKDADETCRLVHLTEFLGDEVTLTSVNMLDFKNDYMASLIERKAGLRDLYEIFISLIQKSVKMCMMNIFNNDLKLDNILLRYEVNKWEPYFVDFGQSVIRKQPLGLNLEALGLTPEKFRTTFWHMAPEIGYGADCDKQTEIWSLGWMMYRIGKYFDIENFITGGRLCLRSPKNRATHQALVNYLESNKPA